jgi:hypothetical protein
MLYLLLEVAGQQYAVEATRVVEVLPLVQVTVIRARRQRWPASSASAAARCRSSISAA